MIMYECPKCYAHLTLGKAKPRPDSLRAQVQEFYIVPKHQQPNGSVCEYSGKHPKFATRTDKTEAEIALAR